MSELAEILGLWRQREFDDDAILVTVVHVKGSAYRRPGARMLILGDGTRIGTISGGCLETDVARKAWWWTEEGTAIRVFDHTAEEAAWDFGLGCNGVITLLLQRVSLQGVRQLLDFIGYQQQNRQVAIIATVIRAQVGSNHALGQHQLFCAQDEPHIDSLVADPELQNAIQLGFKDQQSRLLHLEHADVFVECLLPPQRLFIFGAGHDAIPLTVAANLLGWQVTVVDHRKSYLRPDRFPNAEKLHALADSADISSLAIGVEDAVVMMTHNYPQDQLLLPQLLQQSPLYLGLLGPRTRAEKLFNELGQTSLGANVFAPIGLDIGGDHPASIALAIIAEIQAVLAKRVGGHLRQRQSPIHAPVLEVGEGQAMQQALLEQQVQVVCDIT